jgi:hypothetical protein
LDLITLLRKEMVQQPTLLAPFGFQITDPATQFDSIRFNLILCRRKVRNSS